MARTRRRTPEKDWRPAFLKELCRTACVLRSAAKAKVGRRTVYDRREADPEFALAWDEAIQFANEHLEAEARRRATEGTLRPIFQGGKLVGKVREYSDTLLIFLLKAHNPAYRGLDKIIHAGDPSAPIKHDHEHTVTGRIEQYTEAFARAADREESSGVPGNDSGEPVDS